MGLRSVRQWAVAPERQFGFGRPFGKGSHSSGECRFGSSVYRQGFVYCWGMSRAKFKFFLPKLKFCRGVVSIHEPWGYEPNTLTTAPLGL